MKVIILLVLVILFGLGDRVIAEELEADREATQTMFASAAEKANLSVWAFETLHQLLKEAPMRPDLRARALTLLSDGRNWIVEGTELMTEAYMATITATESAAKTLAVELERCREGREPNASLEGLPSAY